MKKYFPLPDLSDAFLARHPRLVLLESSLPDTQEHRSYLFFDPVDEIRADRPSDVPAAFRRIDRLSKEYFLAGYFPYELGCLLNGMKPVMPAGPLLHLGVFRRPAVFDHGTGRWTGPRPKGLEERGPGGGGYFISQPVFSMEQDAYERRVRRIQEHIRRGDTYQVNLTGDFEFDFFGSAYALYRDLKRRQPVPYGAFCRLDGETVLSLSPELYFRRDGDRVVCRPMKGTAARGTHGQGLSELRNAKNRAENVMIVDLVRNDLGRICRTGSVDTVSLYDAERHPGLYQMTSTVTGRLRPGTGIRDIFESMFPGGSVTGAPKIRTMQIIRAVEGRSRGVYCGALGMIAPGDRAVFNIPIRTVVLSDGQGRMGVGGGITIGSVPADEYRECLLKAGFLTGLSRPFRLLETLRWVGRYLYFREHLARMGRSARIFRFRFEAREIRRRLMNASRRFDPKKAYRVRVLTDKKGRPVIESAPLKEFSGTKGLLSVVISPIRTDPEDIFLRHKTDRRELYDRERRRWAREGYFDVLFFNTRGELTEGAITNVIVVKNGWAYTPPVSCGLLPGIYRGLLLQRGELKEKILRLKDLMEADRIFLCNSVRGVVEVAI